MAQVGRPTVATRAAIASFSLPPEQLDQMRRDARALGLTVSEFIRQLHKLYREYATQEAE
jgi:hypothetical protein